MNNEAMLAVVIVNYKTPDLVINCVQSLLPELHGLRARVVIVDNHSDDGSVSSILAWLQDRELPVSQVLLIESPGNLGFAGGNNIGIRSVTADHYLLLNSDTIVQAGVIGQLLETLDRHPDAGIASPKLVGTSGETQMSCFKFHRPLGELVDVAQTSVVDNLFRPYVIRIPVSTEIVEPEWTSFACVLVRKQVFDQVGLLDDKFFMYFEDVEFCYRLRAAGWKIVHNPVTQIVHIHGGSSSFEENVQACKRLPIYFYESRTRYFYVLFGWGGLMLANVSCMLGLSVAMLRRWLQGKRIRNPEFKGIDIWSNFFHPTKSSSMLR